MYILKMSWRRQNSAEAERLTDELIGDFVEFGRGQGRKGLKQFRYAHFTRVDRLDGLGWLSAEEGSNSPPDGRGRLGETRREDEGDEAN